MTFAPRPDAHPQIDWASLADAGAALVLPTGPQSSVLAPAGPFVAADVSRSLTPQQIGPVGTP